MIASNDVWIITNDKIIHHVMKCPIDINVNYYFKKNVHRFIMGCCGQVDEIERKQLSLFTRIDFCDKFFKQL